MILVTGATGSVGRSLVGELLARKAGPVRAMCRSAKDAAALPQGVDTVVADFGDPASLDRALERIAAAYLVCAAVPQLVEFETNFLRACVRAGTPHIVLQSALGAGDFDKSFPSWHRRAEEAARSLNVPCAVLRPNGFMQNIAKYSAASIRAQDCFYDALGSARISHIDVRDIAVAAAAALTDSSTVGRVYELHGPEAIGNDELARRLSLVGGRPIRYVELTPEQMLQGALVAGMPEAIARPVVELYEYYRSGRGEGSSEALRTLIGREPRTVDSYLAEIAPQLAT